LRNWDKGLDYEKTKRQILEKMKELKMKRGVNARKALAYCVALLFQLRNGSRVSEAVDATIEWAKTKKKEVEVRVRKHKTPDTRKMVAPEELKEEDRLDVASVIELIKPASVKMFAKRNLGFNSHSLRYARITYLAKKGISPSIIAKITHHRDINYVLRYTEQKTADEINRDLA